MILVLTGTHAQPFDRLVDAAAALAAGGERVVVQAGASGRRPTGCETCRWFAPDRLAALADEADVIVSHGGPGSLYLAWDRGLRPVVVPRDPARGEHVDDHQQRFARTLGGRAAVVWTVEALPGAVESVRGVLRPGVSGVDAADPAFTARFADLVDRVIDRPPTSPARLVSRLLGADLDE